MPDYLNAAVPCQCGARAVSMASEPMVAAQAARARHAYGMA